MALAMMWVSRVIAASLMMSLPGLGGTWLDARWGTKFLGAAGFVLGLVSGAVYLIAVTRQADALRRAKSGQATLQGDESRTPGGRGPQAPHE
jgi:hypothetical protein